MSEWKEYLASIYYNVKHPGSYAGPDKLYQAVKKEGKFKIGKYRIRKWLQDQETYSLTRAARRKFKRNRVIVEGMDSMWDMDLADMTQLAKQNDGVKYILVVIDIFSRYTWCEPLKSKEGDEVVRALKRIIEQGRQSKLIRTDKGREFRNKKLTAYLKDIGIHHIVTQNEPKANYAERVIQTLILCIHTPFWGSLCFDPSKGNIISSMSFRPNRRKTNTFKLRVQTSVRLQLWFEPVLVTALV